MKKVSKNSIILLCILCLLILILLNSNEVKTDIIIATELWLTKVFPSLFPMFILSSLLIDYQFPEILAKYLGIPFAKIFHTSSYGVFVFIMSFLSGTPSSAFLVKDLQEQKKITKEEASFLLTFTFFSNPLFLLNMLNLIFPQNSKIVLKIILLHYGTNFIIGLLFRPKKENYSKKINLEKKPIFLGSSLSKAIKKALDTLILILGTICFYYMLANLFSPNIEPLKTYISGFFELTQGLNKLITLNVSLNLKEVIAIFFISFGGLSIHTQVNSILKDTNISYTPFLKGRILHALLSVLLIIIIP